MRALPIFLAPLVAASALLAGCNTPPPRADPFAGIQAPSSSPYAHLTIALVPSENARNATSYLATKKIGGVVLRDPSVVFKEITDVFSTTFGGVVKIERLQDAKNARADLVAIVDLYMKKGATMDVDSKVLLLTPDGDPIDELHAHGTQSQYAYVSLRPEPYMVDAARKAGKQLKSELLSSAKLSQFSDSRTGPPPAAPSPAAPRAKSFQSDIDTPAYGGDERPDNFALVIGIETYASIPAAEFAERDAAAVKAHLLAMGYPERNILYLTGQQASRASLAKNIESWLPKNVGEKSTVFFYYSGHGAPDAKTGEAYLLPWDADAQSLEFTAYPLKRLYEKLNALKAKKVIAALDACFSGGGGRSVLPPGARPLVTKVDTGADAAGKLVVLAASAGDEITGTDQAQGHGLFTYNFLKGLSARQGDATVRELYDYLRPKVQDAARRSNRDQTPQLIPADPGDRASPRLR